MMWWGPIDEGLAASQVHHLELRTTIRVPEDGTYLIGTSGLGRFSLTVDGTTVLDATFELPQDADVVEGIMKPPQQAAQVALGAGRDIPVVLTYQPAQSAAMLGAEAVTMLTVQLNLVRQEDDDAELDRAVELAANSDVAVVVVGTTEEVESEGFDRMSLALPGRQDELVARIAAVNPRTIVVVNSGAPVLCRGPRTSRQSCWHGSPAKSSAMRLRTSSPDAWSPVADCPPPGRCPKSGIRR